MIALSSLSSPGFTCGPTNMNGGDCKYSTEKQRFLQCKFRNRDSKPLVFVTKIIPTRYSFDVVIKVERVARLFKTVSADYPYG